MASTIEFIKTRYLTDDQVAEVNFVIKARADRYVAGSRGEDLYPEKVVSKSWADLRTTLLPPGDEPYRFGGEMFASFENGHIHYQDEFGRTEKPREWLLKAEPKLPPRPRDYCPCGSGQSFGNCCRDKPPHLRMSWTEKSTRERNMMFMDALAQLFELGSKDWDTVPLAARDRPAVALAEAGWQDAFGLYRLAPSKADHGVRAGGAAVFR